MYLSKFADGTKLGAVVVGSNGCTVIQRDLYRLEKWVKRDLMKFQSPVDWPPHCERNRDIVEKVSQTATKVIKG